MKIVEARNAPSAAVVGCITGGKCNNCATKPKSHSIGPSNSPTNECEKFVKSIADVMEKKVVGPLQSGRKRGMASTCPTIVRQQKPLKAWYVLRSERTINHVKSGAISNTTRFKLMATPSRINTAISRQSPFLCT